MTIEKVRERLNNGEMLSEIFNFTDGQDCLIYKGEWNPGDDIIYIPDIDLNKIPIDRTLEKWTEDYGDEIELAISNMYTGRDFVMIADGDRDVAEKLFYYCDWQNPSSAIDEVLEDIEEQKEIKYVYEIINKIKEHNCYFNTELYNELFNLYAFFNHYIVKICIEKLAKELIDKSKYDEATRLLKEFQTIRDNNKLYKEV